MLQGIAKTWEQASRMLDSARMGRTYVVVAHPREMSPKHVASGKCPCDGTHWAIYREPRDERITPRSIAAEALDRAPRPAHKVYRPRKGSASPKSRHYAAPMVNANGLDADTLRRLNDQAALARIREACATQVSYRIATE